MCVLFFSISFKFTRVYHGFDLNIIINNNRTRIYICTSNFKLFIYRIHKNRRDGMIVNEIVIHQKPHNEQLNCYMSPHRIQFWKNTCHKASRKRPEILKRIKTLFLKYENRISYLWKKKT